MKIRDVTPDIAKAYFIELMFRLGLVEYHTYITCYNNLTAFLLVKK